ncbi:MAG: sulfurtransferase [Anaerolineales bacterium]
MAFDSIINVHQLNSHLNDPNWLVVDCRYDLFDPEYGEQAYLSAHIPGAVFADINTQLSGPVIPGKTGRHPLPQIDDLTKTFSNWGIDENTQVVGYDDGGGKFAARLWWLLHWLGHPQVAVLDGGIDIWKNANLPLETSPASRDRKQFIPNPQPQMIINLSQMNTIPSKLTIIDSRAPERYAGKIENIDPVAGRIPRAKNRFFQKNLQEDLTFLTPKVLKNQFSTLLKESTPDNVVFYCGSGITGSHNVLAMYMSGLGMPKLYPGSWSEWITDPSRPIEKDN